MADPKRVRVTFFPPGAEDHVAGAWADLAPCEGGFTLTLLHDYGNDLKPEPGWEARGRAGRFLVRDVKGRVLTCEEVA